MYFEDVKIKPGDTVPDLAIAYGHADWHGLWNAARNSILKNRRGAPDGIQPGDTLMVPIPWKVTSRVLVVEPRGVGFEAKRDGEKGTRLSWVQTVFQSNQPVRGTTAFCVDGCPPDDDLPFYWTEAELRLEPERRLKFIDHPQRPSPSPASGTTRWRAIVSLAVATEKRVTVFDSWVWGFDMTPASVITKVGPRAATHHEFAGHLNLLKKGVGTQVGTFSTKGWMFRAPP